MSNDPLENLAKITHQLEIESAVAEEIALIINSGSNKLADAQNSDLSVDSKFGLAYDAAYALALAALRRQGYRAKTRYIVFQCLAHTSDLNNEQVRVLVDAHSKRNRSEYEGTYAPDEATVKAVISVAKKLLAAHTI